MTNSTQLHYRFADVAHTLSRWFELISWPILLLGVILRLTVRDRIPFLSAAFYATPAVILAALALILMFWHLARQDKRLAGLAAVLAAFSIMATVHTNVRIASQPRSFEGDSIVMWNMRNFACGWKGPTAKLAEMRPDIAGIVEGGWPGLAHSWRKAFPEYQFSRMYNGLAVMTRGEILEDEVGSLGPHGRYVSAQVAWSGNTYRVIMVDLLSTPTVSRRPALARLAELAEQYADEPLLVMGDFNTPRDSAHFDLLPSTFSHAFATAGRGYAATWPFPLPVLDLDHVWLNDNVEVANCRHGSTFLSDHRPVMLDCRVKGGSP